MCELPCPLHRSVTLHFHVLLFVFHVWPNEYNSFQYFPNYVLLFLCLFLSTCRPTYSPSFLTFSLLFAVFLLLDCLQCPLCRFSFNLVSLWSSPIILITVINLSCHPFYAVFHVDCYRIFVAINMTCLRSRRYTVATVRFIWGNAGRSVESRRQPLLPKRSVAKNRKNSSRTAVRRY